MKINVLRINLLITIFLMLCHTSTAQSDTPIYLLLKGNSSGSLLAGAGTQGLVHILDTNTGEIIFDLSLFETTSIWALAWSPDGKYLAFGSFESDIFIYCTDETATADCAFGTLVANWNAQTEDLLDLDWNPDSTQIVVASQDALRSLSIWDINDQELLGYVTGLGVNDVDWSPDGRWIAYANVDTGVAYIDAQTIQPNGAIPSVHLLGNLLDATSVAWNHTSTRLAVGEGSIVSSYNAPIRISIWEVGQDEPLLILEGHTSIIENIEWNSRDNYLASVSFDTQIIVWDAVTGEILATYQSPDDGFITLMGITWVGDSNSIAYGMSPPSIVKPSNHD
ncbi:MAG: hypothetical protein AAF846_15890 [Chloroflexota bacterium]